MSTLNTTLRLSCIFMLTSLYAQTPSPYDDWKAAHGIASDVDDSDGDSIPALMEYFTGTPPTRHDDAPVPEFIIADGIVQLRFAHDPVVSDVKATLQQWTSAGGWQEVAMQPLHDGQTDRYPLSEASAAQGIFRFEVARGSSTHFLSGADISALTRIEQQGGVFRKDGVPGDAIDILKAEGINMFRLRLFVDPNGSNVVVNDLAYTLELAARIKAAGSGLLLDLHYSDTWADPGKQYKPAAWEGLSFEALRNQVEVYTASVIAAFAAQGTLPDIVQIGNEVTTGMIWPEGQLYTGNTLRQWVQFTDLLKAGIRGARSAVLAGHVMKIMIHIDKGADWNATRWFFDKMREYSVEYDVIGLSYYPWWHGTLGDVATTFYQGARRYKKPMVMVETAYPHRFAGYWTTQPNMAWDISESGQAAFLQDLATVIRDNAGHYGLGVFYWYPEAIVVPGLDIWNGGATALFSISGEVHEGASRMRPAP